MEPDDIPPSPGTDEAIDLGCLCPIVDNGFGRGCMHGEGVFIMVVGCPVHHWDPLMPYKDPAARRARRARPEVRARERAGEAARAKGIYVRDRVDNAALRAAFLRGLVPHDFAGRATDRALRRDEDGSSSPDHWTATQIARAAGCTEGAKGRVDTSQLKRRLGIMTHNGAQYHSCEYDFAVRVARAMGYAPTDLDL